MKTLYIECNMGAAGDMLMAALLELHPDPEGFIERMNKLGIPSVTITKEVAIKSGITGTQVRVRVGDLEEESSDVPVGEAHHAHNAIHNHDDHEHNHSHHYDEHEHHHNHEHTRHHHNNAHQGSHDHSHDNAHHHHAAMSEISEIVNALPVSGRVKSDVLGVYSLIAEAESEAHGVPVDAIHFHEVGMMDAVADIVGVSLLMDELAPQRVVVSPIHVGSGQVKCAHGILPVPAPATAYILRGVPIYGGKIAGELCTPTGAALLKHFADEFGEMPPMITEAIGYGMGMKDFPVANVVRAFFGESGNQNEEIAEIVCNLDDMTGEELGFALDVLVDNGALDVYMVPTQGKKSRPGQMLVCLCPIEDEKKMAQLMLKHTTTFGARSRHLKRFTLNRTFETIETEFGPVRVKTGSGFEVTKSKPEYEDLAKLARENDISIFELKNKLNK